MKPPALSDRRRQLLGATAQALANEIPIIGVGGITSAASAKAKIDAGAALVQIYTGMIYRGPELIGECVKALRN